MINQADKEQEKVNQKLAVKLKDKAIIIPAFILAGILLFYFFTHSQSVQQPPIASQGYCNRSKPYPMPAEFSRALSLINERTLQTIKSMGVTATPDPSKSVANCLDIQYADLSAQNAEGFFMFDPNSSADDLRIYVDNSYKGYDDILTAILLRHETIHALQYVRQKFEGESLSCYKKEFDAFMAEHDFIVMLNKEEQMSVIQRVISNPYKNSAYEGVNQLFQINLQAQRDCNSTTDECYHNSLGKQVEAMVENNPFYQKECGLNQGSQ